MGIGISPIDETSIGATVQLVNKERASVLAVAAMILLLGMYVTVWQSSVPPIVNQTTIGECGPGQDPRTTLCFDPGLP